MIECSKPAGMSLNEINYYLENNIPVSDLATRQFICRKKRFVFEGAFKNCISRGRKWKLAFETKEEANEYINERYGEKAYSYACHIHGFHVSVIDQGSYDRGWLLEKTMESDAEMVSVTVC